MIAKKSNWGPRSRQRMEMKARRMVFPTHHFNLLSEKVEIALILSQKVIQKPFRDTRNKPHQTQNKISIADSADSIKVLSSAIQMLCKERAGQGAPGFRRRRRDMREEGARDLARASDSWSCWSWDLRTTHPGRSEMSGKIVP